MNKHIHTLLSISLALLTACGGGGNSNSSTTTAGSTNTGGNPAVVTPIAPTTTVRGTVATGQAWISAQVNARCLTGQWTTQTDDAGRYQLQVQTDALPCMLQARSANGTALFSAAIAQPSDTVANITQLTDLVLARLWDADPAAVFANATREQMSLALTNANAKTAQAEVAQAFAALVNIGSDTSVIGTAFAAASAGKAGDAHDRLLDTLRDSITADQWRTLRAAAAGGAAMPAIVKGPANSLNPAAPVRVFVVFAPHIIDALPDTNPWALRSEPALGLWPMVSDIDHMLPLEFVALRAGVLPDGIWPLHFQSWEWSNGVGAKSGYRNNGACSVSKVGQALVATVGSRTWSVQMDGIPTLRLANGFPAEGDAMAYSVTLRTVGTKAILRHVQVRAQNDQPMVHPQYGAFQGGTSIELDVTYDPLEPNAGARATLLVKETLPNTDPYNMQVYPLLTHHYQCIDRDYVSVGNTGLTPADSTGP